MKFIVLLEVGLVFVIKSNDFEVDLHHLTSSNDTYKTNLRGFPTFYSGEGMYLTPVNLWLNHLVNIKHAKDINSPVRALKRYWNFLEENKFAWDHFPSQKSLKPTYRYRNDNLLLSVKKGDLKASTASLYMQHVISFYEWATNEKLIAVCSESKPFEYETIEIANYGMMKHLNNSFLVKSTDLRIRVPNRNIQQSLNPLSEKEIEIYGQALKQCNIEFRLHQLLQLNTGLRVMEACTFPLEAVIAPPYESRRLDITIGPHNGVQTKYGATRTIEIGAVLMHQLYLYAISERRLKKSSKHCTSDQGSPLLLNKNGRALTANSIQNHFLRLRNKISDRKRISFRHKTHDLRATYGTYRLASLLGHIPENDAIALLMSWLGHKNESTTWKYIRFLRKESVNQKAILMLDGILEDALA